MQAEDILGPAIASGQKALNEYQAKQLLAAYGVSVTSEIFAKSVDDAVLAGKEIGFPLVLKGCGANLMHKSEGGWVRVGISDPQSLQSAAEELLGRGDANLEGLLVQEMVSGNRELVMGLIRDAQFGPCVMLGLGGVLTEVLKDTVFRMAPINENEAADMIEELRCRPMLNDFRGQKPANMDSIQKALVAVGNIGMERDEVAEIDVNPLIITPDGDLKAVDALVVLNG